MTRIDFYILQQGDRHGALLYACRLIEKAWLRGHRVFAHCENASQSEEFDQLLWQYRADSFLPHSRDPDDPIAVGTADQLGEHCDVLVNLASAIPEQFSRFHRLAEIVCQEESWLRASRQRFSDYKQRGYPLHRHTVAVQER